MYASIGTSVPEGDGWTFEPKYDGIRVLAFVTGRRQSRHAERQRQNEAVPRDRRRRFARWPARRNASSSSTARSSRSSMAKSARFQALQDRMHVKDAGTIARHSPGLSQLPSPCSTSSSTATGILLKEPWSTRRKHLEALASPAHQRPGARSASRFPGDGEEDAGTSARRDGWEGVIAKRTSSQYEAGRPLERVAQAQDRAPAGIRRRRLDRAAQHTRAHRGDSARLLRRGSLRVRRPHGRRIHAGRPPGHASPSRAAGTQNVALRASAANQRARTLDASRGRRGSQVQRVDRRWKAATADLPRRAR